MRFLQTVQENPKYTLCLIIVLVLVIIYLLTRVENLTPFYLDQIAMDASDPTNMKYQGRDRDILGMSHRDYYLEHNMNRNNVVEGPYYDDKKFVNTTDYLQMPRYYRPKTLTGMVLGTNDSEVDNDTDEIITVRDQDFKERKNKSKTVRFATDV